MKRLKNKWKFLKTEKFSFTWIKKQAMKSGNYLTTACIPFRDTSRAPIGNLFTEDGHPTDL